MKKYFVNPNSLSPSPPYLTISTGARNFHTLLTNVVLQDGDIIEVLYVSGFQIDDSANPLTISSSVAIRSYSGNGPINKPSVLLYPGSQGTPAILLLSNSTLYGINFSCQDPSNFSKIYVFNPNNAADMVVTECFLNNISLNLSNDTITNTSYVTNNIFANLLDLGNAGCFEIHTGAGGDFYINNNSFFQGRYAAALYGTVGTIRVLNNIFEQQYGYAVYTGFSVIGDGLLNYNDAHDFGISDYLQSLTPITIGGNNISADPLFNPDFSIPITSPCVDVGVDHGTESSVPIVDFLNNGRPFNVHTDIGAYEYGASPASGQFPSASFSYAVDSTSNLVTFTDMSDGTVNSWAWIFGDFSLSTAQNPTHLYAATGNYPVSLTVANSIGTSPTVTELVNVHAPFSPSGSVATFTVTYDGNVNNSGTVPIDNNNYQEGDTVTVLGNTGNLGKVGFAFSGWNTAPDGSGTSYVGGSTFLMGASNLRLFAKWVATLSVTYNGNGNTSGTAPVDSNAYGIGSLVTILSQGNLVKTSFNFGGWNTAPDGSGTDYYVGQIFTITDNLLLYAVWARTDTLFWIALSASNYHNSANWSFSSGGPGGAEIPDEDDHAVYDSSGSGNCIFDIPAQILSMTLNGYRGSFIGDCTTTTIYLNSGYASAGDSDSTVHLLGDAIGSSSFGTRGPNNNLPISFDGTGIQNIYNAPNCIFPSIVVNDFLS